MGSQITFLPAKTTNSFPAMLCRLSVSRCKNYVARRGWTMVEMMVAIGAGSLLLTAVAQITVFTARSFVAMGNYADLDRASRNALDVISREIRQAKSVGSYSTSSLQLTNID